MSNDLNLLIPDFRVKVISVLDACRAEHQELRPFFTQRDPWSQAKLWRQSRTYAQVVAAASRMKNRGAQFLAEVLLSVGPQHGKWATNALPGQSWHQWGEAVDCFVVVNGHAEWDAEHPGYVTYARVAAEHGLTAGRYWRGATDPVHVQFREESSPLRVMGWEFIDAAMKERYSVEP